MKSEVFHLRAVIFANGWLNQPVHLLPDDYIISADGGTHHCLALGVIPRAVIGDLDSISEAELTMLKASGVSIVEYPTRKDFTDLELALQYAQELPADQIVILAALGARWDQTLANVLLPAAQTGAPISIVDGTQEIHYLRGAGMLQLYGQPGDTVSLIPLGGTAQGVATQQLEYPLHGETLHFGSTRGVSNVMMTHQASVTLQDGLLVCVVIHQQNADDQAVDFTNRRLI
jgi:thiamine pyrophosphokinase